MEQHTHGSDQRPPRDLLVALKHIDIATTAGRLRAEPAYDSDGRNSQTLHDDGNVRMVASVIAAGREIGAAENEGYVTITLHEGDGSLSRGSERLASLSEPMTAIIAPGSDWSFRAEQDSVLTAFFWGFGRESA